MLKIGHLYQCPKDHSTYVYLYFDANGKECFFRTNGYFYHFIKPVFRIRTFFINLSASEIIVLTFEDHSYLIYQIQGDEWVELSPHPQLPKILKKYDILRIPPFFKISPLIPISLSDELYLTLNIGKTWPL